MPALPETDLAEIRKDGQAQVPAPLRDQLRIEATVRGNSVTIFECHPLWQSNLTEWFQGARRATPLQRQHPRLEPVLADRAELIRTCAVAGRAS
jgi:hypothetical protein